MESSNSRSTLGSSGALMMEEVGYLTEVLSRGHREVPPHHDSTTLMQRGKRPQPATQRDAPVRKLEVQYRKGKNLPAQRQWRVWQGEEGILGETLCFGRRTLPLKTGLSWRRWKDAQHGAPSNPSLREREKLLAALCMIIQELVEGNNDRSPAILLEDFRDWGRRWGQDDDRPSSPFNVSDLSMSVG